MYRTGINEELLRVVSDPPEWIKGLKEIDKITREEEPSYYIIEHQAAIEAFLNATTDSIRLVRASRASEKLLQYHELDELEVLRSKLQASELLRVIPYGRQQDHSAHTLYLYLTGIYLFLAVKPLRKAMAAYYEEDEASPTFVSRFLFQWLFVSLLHDIGYIFQGRARSEIRAVDRMFRASSVVSLIPSNLKGLRNRVTNLIGSLSLKAFEGIENPEDLVATLAYLPWGSNVGMSDDAFDCFTYHGNYGKHLNPKGITSQMLEDYAFRVAASGYDGYSEGTVDHAVASGLFLLRYSTFWSFLANKEGYEDVFATFQASGYPSRDIVAACFATAAHNMILRHAKSYPLPKLDDNPLLYLGILCDELQKWDRFPAGERHLIELEAFENYCTDSERVQVAGDWDGDRVIFYFEPASLSDKVRGALRDRLEGWEDLIAVEAGPPPIPDDGVGQAAPIHQDDQ
jgi:hypothetical protein